MIFRAITLFCLLFVLSISSAQDIVVNSRALTISDGMVGRNVRSISEDLQSRIWIATDLGVTVYDGLELAKPDGLPAAIDNVRFDEIHCSADGLLWFWSIEIRSMDFLKNVVDNIQVYDPVENKMVEPFDRSKIEIKKIFSQDNGKLWLTTHDGKTYEYDTELTSELDIEQDQLTQIFENGNTRYQLYLDRLEEHTNNEIVRSTSLQFKSRKAFHSRDGHIYFVTDFTNSPKMEIPLIGMYDPSSHAVVYSDYKNNDLGSFGASNQVFVSEYERNIVLIAGLEIITIDSDNLTVLNRQASHGWERMPVVINDCYTSAPGRYWMALNEGMLMTEFSERRVKNYFQEESYSLRGIDGWNEDSLLVATYSGTFLLNKENGDYSDEPLKMIDPLFYGIVDFNGHSSLIGTHTRDFILLNQETQEIQRKVFADVPYAYQAYLPQAVENGEYWFGTSGGAFRYDSEIGNFIKPTSIANSPMDKHTIRSVKWIDEKYFFCTEKGMFVADENLKPEYVNSLGDIIITDVVKASGHYWVSTFGEGVKKLDQNYAVVEEFNKSTFGFGNDFIYSIHDDGLGYFWFPSNNGLIRFEIGSNEFSTFLPKDGFANYEYNNGSSYVDEDGSFYFGGTDGLSKITPSDFVGTEKEVNFEVSKLGYSESDGELVPIKFQQEAAINLPSNYLTFSLSISSKNYPIEEGIKYIYRILEYSDGWRSIENNKLSLNRLPFGDHTLEIKPLVTGHRRAALISIPIAVAAPFYFQPIFILSVLCGLALLTFLYIRWRTNQLRLRNILLSNQVNERTQELSKKNVDLLELNDTRDRLFGIIAHDLRGPLIGFKDLDKKIKYLNAKNRVEDLEQLTNTVQENYENLTSLLDNLLNWISIQRGRLPIKIEPISLNTQVDEALNLYDHSIKQKEIEIIREGPSVEVLADPDALDILLRNLLNNALKYSHPAGRIWIASFENEEEASLVVEDEGVGMNEDELTNLFSVKARRGRQGTRGEKSTGLGLPLCKEFVNLMGGRIEVKSEMNKGTRFVISLPKYRSSHPNKYNSPLKP